MRDKITTLFNKNHITVTRTDTDRQVTDDYFTVTDTTTQAKRIAEPVNFSKRKWVPTKKEVIEKESPLGFVYTYTSTIEGHWEYVRQYKTGSEKGGSNAFTINKYAFYVGKSIYNISYPIEFAENKVGQDMRPWEVADLGMDDHYVTDLLNVMNKLCDNVKHIHYKPHNHQYYSGDERYAFEPHYDNWDFTAWKRRTYTDLFGNPDGPKYMTNNEKILAHGFDLKTSFRKM